MSMGGAEPGNNMMISNSSLTWVDWQPPGFDPGVKLAVFHGDPTKAGDYVLRLRFPDGYRFPVHYHPGGEHLTVLSGTFLLAMGSSNDWSQVKTYGPGDFIFAPALHPHYGGARGVTEIQLHGQGPFGLILGSPK
jgi:quercetin dioxygenase-like cupin family protein